MTRSGLNIQNGISFSGIEEKPLFILIVIGVILIPFFLKFFFDWNHQMDQNIEKLRKTIDGDKYKNPLRNRRKNP